MEPNKNLRTIMMETIIITIYFLFKSCKTLLYEIFSTLTLSSSFFVSNLSQFNRNTNKTTIDSQTISTQEKILTEMKVRVNPSDRWGNDGK